MAWIDLLFNQWKEDGLHGIRQAKTKTKEETMKAKKPKKKGPKGPPKDAMVKAAPVFK